jgi:hypothetical protein
VHNVKPKQTASHGSDHNPDGVPIQTHGITLARHKFLSIEPGKLDVILQSNASRQLPAMKTALRDPS